MANILLGITGSVAAIRTPTLVACLDQTHDVKIIATKAACYFFDYKAFRPASLSQQLPQITAPVLYLDEDEWTGSSETQLYQRGDLVLHIELRKWADIFLIAPLDANTLGKIAFGLCDNLLMSCWRAWDQQKPMILAPAMNTMMWQHPSTRRQLTQLAADFTDQEITQAMSFDELIQCINESSANLRIIPPQAKRLACGDIGIGAMAEVTQIIEVVQQIEWE